MCGCLWIFWCFLAAFGSPGSCGCCKASSDAAANGLSLAGRALLVKMLLMLGCVSDQLQCCSLAEQDLFCFGQVLIFFWNLAWTLRVLTLVLPYKNGL